MLLPLLLLQRLTAAAAAAAAVLFIRFGSCLQHTWSCLSAPLTPSLVVSLALHVSESQTAIAGCVRCCAIRS
jgi:hypothetical protein